MCIRDSLNTPARGRRIVLLTTPAAIHRRPLETCVRGCRWLPLLVPCGLGAESTSCGQQTYTKIMENRPRRPQNEVPEASGVSFLRSQGGVLRSPVPCCTRSALRASSEGAPEASRGRSRGARGPLGRRGSHGGFHPPFLSGGSRLASGALPRSAREPVRGEPVRPWALWLGSSRARACASRGCASRACASLGLVAGQ